MARNRLASYMYPIRDRRPAPGRKTKNRLKKAKQLMSRRLANQLRQGREHKIIHRTQKKLNFRRWLARPYDEVAAWEKGNEAMGRALIERSSVLRAGGHLRGPAEPALGLFCARAPEKAAGWGWEDSGVIQKSRISRRRK